jgi:CDP-diacylglycerol--glycerol-3-phosphate 3-phosphatidyltransferase
MKLEVFHNWENIATIPNSLTLSRFILATIASILIANEGTSMFTSGLLIWAAATDGLDGYIARKLHQVTEFGKKLDPAVDALSIQAILSALAYNSPDMQEKLLYIASVGINSGYILQLFARWEWLSESIKKKLGASKIGKVKTATYLTSLGILAWIPENQEWANTLKTLAEWWIFSGTLMTLWCWYDYNKKANKLLGE